MRLDEARKILNENGYEMLDEGVISRALGIGLLSLMSIVNAAPRNINDFKSDSTLVELNREEVHNNIIDVIQKNDDAVNTVFYDTENDVYLNCDFDKSEPVCNVYEEGDDIPVKIEYNKNGIREYASYVDEEGALHKAYYDNNGNIVKVQGYYDANGDTLRWQTDFKKLKGNEYYISGEIKTEYNIDKNGNYHGIFKAYKRNGEFAGSKKYNHGELVGFTKCTDGRRGDNRLQCQIPMHD